VVIVTAEFERLAHQMANHLGHPSLRVVVLPYPLEGLPADQLVAIARSAYPEVLASIGATP
jgi:hypothetical protein